MADFSKIIIVSDVDGTFLGEDSRMIDKNADAVRYFIKNGGKFTFVTGRNPIELKRLIPNAEELANLPLGCCNGIYLYDIKNSKAVHDELIEAEYINKILDYSLKDTDRDYDIIMVHGCDFYSFGQKEFRFVKDYPDNCHIITRKDTETLRFNKLVFIGYPETVERESQNVLALLDNKTDCVRSLPYAREFVPKGKAKNVAVEQLKKIYPHCKIFAVGDYENDIGMFRVADYCACPDNALDCVKEICDIQVCHHNDGAIAHLIQIIEEKYIG